MKRYQPQDFEQKWVSEWEKEQTYKTNTTASRTNFAKASSVKGKKYVLDMFPYPSGAGLHVGHPRGYVGSDILARFYRMQGYSVLHPMGWDAFGLPAENAAIKAKRNPVEITKENIANFTRQLKMLGFSYDWSRELATTDPEYYKWTQWLFIQLYKMGLLYKKLTPVYYCPFCKTGLAQEEVLPDNTHERCHNPIEMRDLPQWIFRITTYADRLVDELDGLNWPSGILEMQRNWIGRKVGMKIHHKVVDMDLEFDTFTAYPAWSWADTFIVIAPEHPLVQELVKGTKYAEPVRTFLTELQKVSKEERKEGTMEKKGVFTGRYAKDPFGGPDMPIWLANFALMDFGTGIIRCSAHDPRDYEFAKKYDIPLKEVMERTDPEKPVHAHVNQGVLKDSGPFTGKPVESSIDAIVDWIEKQGIGVKHKTYHLRDWIFSRQRYWGEPIPMIYCQICADKGISYWDTEDGKDFQETYQKISKVNKELQKSLVGWFPIDQKNLPLELPYLQSYEPNESGQSPLANVSEWIDTTCPHCGSPAVRESDTMPNWAGSCWYFLAFAAGIPNMTEKSVILNEVKNPERDSSLQSSGFSAQNDKAPSLDRWQKKIMDAWMPVDWYVGGAEHAVLHLLYSRFWVKALQDLGLLNFNEPFLGLKNQGIILAADHRKMSKSFGNVVNPDDVVAEYGADALRVYEMFMAPFNQEIPWSTTSLQGSYRFVARVWTMFQQYKGKITDNGEQITEDSKLVAKLHKTIAKVTKDIADVKYNTAIAAMMEFLNEWEAGKRITDNGQQNALSVENAKKFLKILAPFAVFTTEEIWRSILSEKKSIHLSAWPEVDESLLKEETYDLPVQVNGKMRGVITVASEGVTEEDVTKIAQEDAKVGEFLKGKAIRKVIYVPNKILNFVV